MLRTGCSRRLCCAASWYAQWQPNGAQAIADARDLLNRLDTVTLTRQRLDDAGTLLPLRLRSLDAIHLVASQRAGDALRAAITYDARMLSAAADLGISTTSPR